ncbi:MAG: hypothetical protein AB2L11_00740 [Syntrophobacteraceae bacterium]
MAHLIYIEQGAYPLEEAFFITPGYAATTLEDAVLEVYLDNKEERRVRGGGMAANYLIVELLEENEDIDLLLSLGQGFHYLAKNPVIRAGKVFSPDVKSLIHFSAPASLQKLSRSEYLDIRSKLSLVGEQV